MPVSYPKSSTVSANTDATATQYNNLRSDAVEPRIVFLTSGENITALDPVYIKAADGKAYRCKGAGTEAEAVIFGIATATVAAPAAVSVICFGLMDGFSGLTVGSVYYLGSTYGSISASSTLGINAVVGLAISATTMMVTPRANNPFRAAGSFNISGTAVSANGLIVQSTLAAGGSSNGALVSATMQATGNDNVFVSAATVAASVTNLNEFYGIPTVPSGQTVTNRNLIYAQNAVGSGTITNSFFARFDAASPFLTGGTSHTTPSDEIQVNCNGTTKYIKLYT